MFDCLFIVNRLWFTGDDSQHKKHKPNGEHKAQNRRWFTAKAAGPEHTHTHRHTHIEEKRSGSKSRNLD